MTDIERNIFHEFCRTFNTAAEQGFSQTTHPDDDFISALRHNNAVFAAFKTHRLQNDIARQLLDDNGNLKPFEQWKNDVRTITSHQCDRWLRTEYDTAVIRAHQAADWQQFQREADILPNLKWMPSTSPNPGADHQIFWGTIRPVNDPFWKKHRPGDRWNCKCSLSNTDEPATIVPTGNDTTSRSNKPQPGLDNNPGIDAKLFSDTHPYIANANPGAKEAVEKAVRELEGVYEEIPTERGKVLVHPKHGKNEVKENTRIATYLANKHGYDIELLPRKDGTKSADSFNHTLHKKQEYKLNVTASKSSIDNLIREAKKQADSIVLQIDSKISLGDLKDALTNRLRRSPNITDITLIIEEKDVTYNREQMLKPSFKIQPEDFK